MSKVNTNFLDADIDFQPEKISYVGDVCESLEIFENDPDWQREEDQEIILMHECETQLMKEHADFVCGIGGDILEIGFGMGISADFIQENNPKSHTIIEIHPQIIEKAKEWAKDKPNVTIIEGDWVKVLPNLTEGNILVALKKFDGIFYDPISTPYGWDFHARSPDLLFPHAKSNTRISHWNPLDFPGSVCGFMNHPKYKITFDEFNIDPKGWPKQYEALGDVYYMPRIFINE